MNVLRCSNGHYFDADQFESCPHCGAAISGPADAAGSGKGKKKGLFGHKSKDSFTGGHSTGSCSISASRENNQASKTSVEGRTPSSNFGNGQSETIGMRQQDSLSKEEAFKKGTTLDFGATLDFWNSNKAEEEEEEEVESESGQNSPEEKEAHTSETRKSSIVPEDEEKHKDPSGESLRDQVRNASASSDGKTTSYFSAITSKSSAQEDNKKPKAIDPVVGWLVCISGARFGESFNIGAGMNSIGRSSNNRIVLEHEETVSREKHAFITYEPKHRQFYVKPGEGSGLTYLNDEFLTETKQISGKSILEFGNSRYIFIPLCGADFTWEDYLNDPGKK